MICARAKAVIWVFNNILGTSSWVNSVSSVLSANPKLFESGLISMKQSGYWALKQIAPPHISGAHMLTALRKDGEGVEVKQEEVHLPPQQPAQQPEDPLEIKRRLVERLLKVDQNILQAALKRTEAAATAMQQQSEEAPAFKPLAPKGQVSPIQLLTPSTFSTGKPVSGKLTSVVKKVNNNNNQGTPTAGVVRRDRRPKPANYVRASPHENELLETCNKIVNPDRNINRFRRKLLSRKAKRLNGLPILDFDTLIYQYLKHADPIHPIPETIPRSLLNRTPIGQEAIPDLTATELAEVNR